MNIEEVARLAHEVKRAYCEALGDMNQPVWEDATELQKQDIVAAVGSHLSGERVIHIDGYEAWGHEQRVREALFCGVVDACRPYLDRRMT